MDLIQKLFKGDKGIWIAFEFLCVISILEFFSSSSSLSYGTQDHWYPLSRHIMTLFVGFIVMVITSFIDYKKLRIFLTYLWGAIAVLTLLYASVKGFLGFGLINGTSRWLYIPGTNLTYQPSELVKLWVLVVAASILSKNIISKERNDIKAFKKICIWTAIPIGLIVLENFSTAFLISICLLIMMWIGQLKSKIFILTGVVAIGLFFSAYGAYKLFPDSQLFKRFPTWEMRFQRFLNTESVPPNEYDIQSNRQRTYANIAISKSGVWGAGIGNSTERDFVSHAYSDLIYAIILEEAGLMGGFATIFLYIMILLRVGKVSAKLEDPYAVLLIQGIALVISLQALMHMFVSVGIIPITGQPLPIISKGGTSIVLICFELGIIQSISSNTTKKEPTLKEDGTIGTTEKTE